MRRLFPYLALILLLFLSACGAADLDSPPQANGIEAAAKETDSGPGNLDTDNAKGGDNGIVGSQVEREPMTSRKAVPAE